MKLAAIPQPIADCTIISATVRKDTGLLMEERHGFPPGKLGCGQRLCCVFLGAFIVDQALLKADIVSAPRLRSLAEDEFVSMVGTKIWIRQITVDLDGEMLVTHARQTEVLSEDVAGAARVGAVVPVDFGRCVTDDAVKLRFPGGLACELGKLWSFVLPVAVCLMVADRTDIATLAAIEPKEALDLSGVEQRPCVVDLAHDVIL